LPEGIAVKFTKGVLAVALALLPIHAMAEDVIQIGMFMRRGDHYRRRKRLSQTRKYPRRDQHGHRLANALRNLISGKYDLILITPTT
jgi:hypothetical protein